MLHCRRPVPESSLLSLRSVTLFIFLPFVCDLFSFSLWKVLGSSLYPWVYLHSYASYLAAPLSGNLSPSLGNELPVLCWGRGKVITVLPTRAGDLGTPERPSNNTPVFDLTFMLLPEVPGTTEPRALWGFCRVCCFRPPRSWFNFLSVKISHH